MCDDTFYMDINNIIMLYAYSDYAVKNRYYFFIVII